MATIKYACVAALTGLVVWLSMFMSGGAPAICDTSGLDGQIVELKEQNKDLVAKNKKLNAKECPVTKDLTQELQSCKTAKLAAIGESAGLKTQLSNVGNQLATCNGNLADSK